MPRFELTINPNYVPDWKHWEGLRELTQNISDQESLDPVMFKKFIIYKSENNTIVLGNENSQLSKSSLLMGSTTKAGKNMAGKWGEGYKLAFLVLCRLGIAIEVSTGNEKWIPKIINSKRYDSRILVVDVSKSSRSKNLSITLEGITPDIYAQFVENYLGICYPTNIKTSAYGNILLDEKYKKKVYVAGLFVQNVDYQSMEYGYDMSPKYINLDRDRKTIREFNLFWETSRIYAHLLNYDSTFVRECQKKNIAGIANMSSHVDKDSKFYKELCELSYKEFIDKHGKKAVAVRNQSEADFIKEKYNGLVPIVVPEIRYEYITRSESHVNSGRSEIKKVMTPYLFISDFIKTNKRYIFGKTKKLLEKELLPEAREWECRLF